MTNLVIDNATMGYHKNVVLKDMNLEFTGNEVYSLLGPNGVGKSTFFKSILGLLPLISGRILLNGKDVSKWNRKEFAKKIAYVPQYHNVPFAFKVIDVVLMGRTAHLGLLGSPSKKDKLLAEECLEMLGISSLKNKLFTEISGGERQMVIIARALAQQPSFMIMDEPTSSLDFGNQIKVIKQINELKKDSLGILMATHSPDHAFMCKQKSIAFFKGNLYKQGLTSEVLTEECLKEMYGTAIQVMRLNGNVNRCICVPHI